MAVPVVTDFILVRHHYIRGDIVDNSDFKITEVGTNTSSEIVPSHDSEGPKDEHRPKTTETKRGM